MKYTGKNPLDQSDRSNWTLNDGTPLSDEQWNEFQGWYKKGAPGIKTPGAPTDEKAAPSDEKTGALGQVWRGLGRGLASDIPLLPESSIARGSGMEGDEGPVETTARLAGEFAPLAIPADWAEAAVAKGLDFAFTPGATARLSKLLGPAKARDALKWLLDHAEGIHQKGGAALRGAIAGTAMDPQHPLKGAATGAVGGTAAGVLGPKISPVIRRYGAPAVGLAGLAGSLAGGHGGGHSWMWPLHYLGYPLASLAAMATGHPGIAGGAASEVRKKTGGDDDEQP